MPYVGFVDVIGANSKKIPAVKGLGIIALYATGSEGIEATAAEVARFKNAGVGVVLIDQTPSLSVFAAGIADIADVEHYAGTPQAAINAILSRQAHGWQSTIYIGDDNLASLISMFSTEIKRDKVLFGVANYNWSVTEAETLLADNPSWAYCQYGDNITNAGTKIPGTDVTCGQAGCDIDVAKASWADQFMIKPPVKEPPFAQPSGMSQTVWPATADFGWTSVAGAEQYHVQVQINTTNPNAIPLVNKSVTTTNLHGVLISSGDYKWRVAVDAGNGHESSGWSAWKTFTVV